jgi:hypothetical protein
MFKLFTGLIVFLLILFIYIHVYFQLRTNNDLELYEIDEGSKDNLEEICNIRQPVIFDFNSEKIIHYSNKTYLLENYKAFEIKIRNAKEENYDSEIYMPIAFDSAIKLFNEDTKETYFSENNTEFLQETGIIKHFQYNDEFLRPYMVSNCNYDIMFGSENTITPFRYELNYRNYFLVTEGSITVKMAPPKSSKYLHLVKDYENFEFRSPINPWKPQQKYVADFDKIKCLEVTMNIGQTIYIPPYWFYSIKFLKNSSVSCFRYRTYMNNIAIIPHIALYALQLQNIKHEVIKKMDINELNHVPEEKGKGKERKKEKEEKNTTSID